MTSPLRPVVIEARAYRVPIEVPVVAAFGTMFNRPCVIVRAVDADGTEGFGEVWCNFPTVGAEHRARLVAETIGPRLVGRAFDSPAAAFAETGRALEVLAIQSAEYGPLAQALAGIDQALWDLAARKAGLPLHRALGGAARARVPAYASGLNPDAPRSWPPGGRRRAIAPSSSRSASNLAATCATSKRCARRWARPPR